MKSYRYPTGIQPLDASLNGGFSPGSLILLEYDVGSPKNRFIREFLKEGLDKEEQEYIVLTDGKIDSLFDEKELQKHSEEELVILDGFTNAFGGSEVKPYTKHRIDDITNINTIHKILRESVKTFDDKKHTRGIIDSLSTLLIAENYHKTKGKQEYSSIPKYVFHQSVMCKNTGSVLMCTLHRGAQNEFIEKTIENISDYILRFETKGEEEKYLNYLSILTSRHYNDRSIKYIVDLTGKKLSFEECV